VRTVLAKGARDRAGNRSDLGAAILPHATFWFPEDLLFDCNHRDYDKEGIFTVDYVA
jgi:hypothetical protein